MAAPTKVLQTLLLILSVFIRFNHLYTFAQEDGEIPKVGIIGGGIGGTSAAYFLRQLFGDKLEVDIFEAERVGGRLAVISIDGEEYEAGGSLIHPRNQYMVNFTQQFGLGIKEQNSGILGLYNNEDGLFFQTSSWLPVSLGKMFWRYGWDIKRIRDWVADMLLSFDRIYDYQNKGMAFTTVEDLIRAMDEKFINYTRITTSTMLKDAGFSDAFIDELVMGGIRNNYGQTTGVHGFVGAVSMAGVEPGLWAVKGGNKNVAEKLLLASKAKLIKGAATHVFQVKSEGGTISYEVQYEKKSSTKSGEDKTGSREYDLLIMATPLKSGSMIKVQFEDFPNGLQLPDVPFHSLEALFIHGQPNATYFGKDKVEDMPTFILTTKPSVFFNSIGKLSPVVEKEQSSEKTENTVASTVWKTFLNKVPTETKLKEIFPNHEDIRIVNWLAYPDYTPKMPLPSFVLHDRLYYINAVESAASAIEMSLIGAKNVALLAFNQWFGHFDKIDELVFPRAVEEQERKPDEL